MYFGKNENADKNFGGSNVVPLTECLETVIAVRTSRKNMMSESTVNKRNEERGSRDFVPQKRGWV